jgi:hypothetical protein
MTVISRNKTFSISDRCYGLVCGHGVADQASDMVYTSPCARRTRPRVWDTVSMASHAGPGSDDRAAAPVQRSLSWTCERFCLNPPLNYVNPAKWPIHLLGPGYPTMHLDGHDTRRPTPLPPALVMRRTIPLWCYWLCSSLALISPSVSYV